MRNMKKKIIACDLKTQYDRSPQFYLAARRIVALAFVPPNEMEDAFEALQNFTPAELQPVLDCFEDSYLGRPHRAVGDHYNRLDFRSTHGMCTRGQSMATVVLISMRRHHIEDYRGK